MVFILYVGLVGNKVRLSKHEMTADRLWNKRGLKQKRANNASQTEINRKWTKKKANVESAINQTQAAVESPRMKW